MVGTVRPNYSTLNVLEQPMDAANIDNKLYINGSWYINDVQVNATAAELNDLSSNWTVANKTGGTLTKGTLVYFSGYDASLDAPTVAKADADDSAKQATHVVIEDIVNDDLGVVNGETTLTDLNTNSFTAVGTLLYSSGTAGEYTETAPTGVTQTTRLVGIVKVKSATIGEIFFFPAIGGLNHGEKYLNNLTPGTISASGAVVVDSNRHQDVVKVSDGGLAMGVSGSEVAVGATAAELNLSSDVSAQTETVIGAGALSASLRISNIALVGSGAVTLAAPNAAMLGSTKIIQMTVDNGDVTLALTNIQGQSSGTTATFNDVGDTLVLVAGASKWTVTGEAGITLS